MGRPRKAVQGIVHQVKLVLTPGEDDDLIRFMAALPARAKANAVKTAMRSGMTQAEETGSDQDAGLYAALGEMVF